MSAASTEVIPVYVNDADAPELERQSVVLASLPGRFRRSTRRGGVVVVPGLRTGWPAEVRAAVEIGARGVFVADPGPAGRDDLQAAIDLATSAGVPVAVGLRFMPNRSWAAAIRTIRSDTATSALAESMVVAFPTLGEQATLVNTLIEQLYLLGQLGVSVTELTMAVTNHDHYIAVARAGELAISLTGLVSVLAKGGISLDLVGAAQRWSAVIPSVSLAGTASISRYSRDGVKTYPARYESGERAVWAQLHSALTAGTPVEVDLNTVATLIVTATELLRVAR
jgi:hypothetical protein